MLSKVLAVATFNIVVVRGATWGMTSSSGILVNSREIDFDDNFRVRSEYFRAPYIDRERTVNGEKHGARRSRWRGREPILSRRKLPFHELSPSPSLPSSVPCSLPVLYSADLGPYPCFLTATSFHSHIVVPSSRRPPPSAVSQR